MCSALYCVIQSRIPSSALRHLVRGYASDAHYPINFVVKHPTFPHSQESPPWGGVNLPISLEGLDGLFPDRHHLKDGSDQEAVNESGGAERDRTADPLLAKQVLSQLSYSPIMGTCGRDGGPG
jgi:hypothetical protein